MADLLDEFGVGPKKDLLDEFEAAPQKDLLSEFGVEAPKVDTTSDAREEGRFRVLSSLPTAFVEGGRQTVDQVRHQFHDRYADHYSKAAATIKRMGEEEWAPSEKETMESQNPLLDQYVLRMNDAISKGRSRKEAAAELLAELDQGAARFSSRAETSKQEAQAHGRKIQEATPKDPSFLEEAAITMARSAPTTALGLGAAAVGGPAAGAVVGGLLGGASAGASTYMEAGEKDPSLQPEQKAKIALVDGLLESIGEGLSLRVALKAGGGFFKRLLETIGAEASSEAITSAMQDANAAATYNPDLSLRDFAYNMALSATAGAMGGGFTAAVVGTGQSVGERLGRQKDDDKMVDDLLAPKEAPLSTDELLKLQPEEQPTELEAQLQASLGQRQNLEDPREQAIAIVQEHVGRLGDDLQAIQAEESVLLQRLRSAAKDKDYTPTSEEAADLQLATQIYEEVQGMTDQDQVVGHMMARILEKGPSDLGRAMQDIFSTEELNFYKSDVYDGFDYQQSTTGEATSPAEYFLIAANRAASGYYPFSHGVMLDQRPTSEIVKNLPDLPLNRLPGARVAYQTVSPQGEAFARTLDKWMQSFFPQGEVILVDRPNYNILRGKPSRPGSHGSYLANGPGKAVIFLDMKDQNDAQMALSLAHEFGHFLTTNYLSKQPKFVKDAVEKTWARQARMLQKQNQRVDASMAERRSPFLAYKDEGPIGEAIVKRPYVRGYLLSFDEWLAHQMERVAMGDRLGDMGKHVAAFLKKAAATIKRWFETYKSDIAPEATYEDFIRLGALREREISLTKQNLAGVEAALQQYGVKDLGDLDIKKLHESLVKSLKNIKAQPELAESVLSATPVLQERAVKAINRLGQRETALYTPQEGNPVVRMSAEEWVGGLEDSYLPGQGKDDFVERLSSSGLNKPTLVGSRVASALKYFLHPLKDTSAYRGDLDKFSRFRKSWHSLEQISKANPHIEQLGRYVRGVRAWSADRMAWVSRADGRLRQWRNLSSTDQKTLGKFLLDQSADGRYYDLKDPNVRRQYPLSAEAEALYQQINSDFQDFINAVEGTLRQQVANRLVKNPMAASAEIQRIAAKFDEIRKQPYFPLARFGRYIVTVRATAPMVIRGKTYAAGEVVHLEAFDTEFAQKAEFDRIRRAYPNADAQMSQVAEDTASLAGMPTLLVESLKSNPDIGLSEAQKAAIDEYLAKIAPGQSFIKHLLKRRTVEGYTEDVLRAYANYFFHGASHLARIKHAQPLNDEIKAIRITAELMTGDVTKRIAIHNYMKDHFKFVMQPENDWAAIRGAVAVAYLGAVPKAALINLTQVPLVTYPHLAAKFGDAKATAAILGAYRDAGAMYHVTKPLTQHEEAALTRWAQGAQALPGDEAIVKKWSKFTTEEAMMLRRAVQETWIDESIAMELAAMSEGSWMTRFKSTSKAGYYARATAHYAMVPFQAAEKLNRRVTAIAAFRLAKKSGATFEQAFEAAREAVSSSQYEYAKWNRPEMLRGKKGLVFMFWQYKLNTLYFAFGGDKGWWRWWLMMLATAGPMGLPFAEDLMNLATWIANQLGDDDKPFNAKYLAKKYGKQLAEQIGVAPDLLLHGASRYGFGLMPFADMSGSLSMGRTIPGTEVLAQQNPSWESTVVRGLEEGGGATASLVMRMIQATTSNDMDLLTRIEKGMPITVGQKLIQGFKAYDRGAVETRGGADLIKFDTTDPWHMAEIIGMAAGFPARRVNDTRESTYLAQDFVRFYQTRRTILLKAVDDSFERGDAQDRRDAIEAIRRYNKQVPSRSLTITREQIVASRRSRERGRGRIESGGHQSRMYNELFKDVQSGDF